MNTAVRRAVRRAAIVLLIVTVAWVIAAIATAAATSSPQTLVTAAADAAVAKGPAAGPGGIPTLSAPEPPSADAIGHWELYCTAGGARCWYALDAWITPGVDEPQEDEPGWDCSTMGNRLCGVGWGFDQGRR